MLVKRFLKFSIVSRTARYEPTGVLRIDDDDDDDDYYYCYEKKDCTFCRDHFLKLYLTVLYLALSLRTPFVTKSVVCVETSKKTETKSFVLADSQALA